MHLAWEGAQFQKMTLVKTTTSRDHVSKTQHFFYVFLQILKNPTLCFFCEFHYILTKITTFCHEFQHLPTKNITPLYIFSYELCQRSWAQRRFVRFFLFLSDITKSDFFIVIYRIFENHLQKHIVEGTFFDDHVQNT